MNPVIVPPGFARLVTKPLQNQAAQAAAFKSRNMAAPESFAENDSLFPPPQAPSIHGAYRRSANFPD